MSQKIPRISKLARTITFWPIFVLKIINEEFGKFLHANNKYFRYDNKTKFLQKVSISGTTNRIVWWNANTMMAITWQNFVYLLYINPQQK